MRFVYTIWSDKERYYTRTACWSCAEDVDETAYYVEINQLIKLYA